MYKTNFLTKLTALFLLFSTAVIAQHHEEHGASNSHNDQHHGVVTEKSEKETLRDEIKADIKHHLKDAHDITLFHSKKDGSGFTIPLPVILWDNGLQVFMSSEFHHGEKVVEKGGNYYKLYHSKIYKTDAQGTITYDEHHHPTNAKPLDFSITKTVVFILLVALFMFWAFTSLAKSYQNSKDGLPSGIGRFLEPLVVFVRDDIAIPNIGKKHYRKYMSYLLTIFFFIWFANLLGLMPFGANITGNITITFALAIMTYLITTFTAKKDYWKHIFWMPGVPAPMKIVLAPIELLGTFIKPFSLMIRLFANMVAGHTVLMSIIALIFIFKNVVGGTLSFGLAFALSILELLVAALQAYIFTVLSALYFGMASEEHDDH
ncbi:MAG: F0F1 ATP synthase subunit A [Flavobacteriaceae bacterium]|nr:F0F1 ATP synthase subunit A [Flavobacteriaceae bacterium]